MRRIAPFLVLFCIAAAQLCAASGASYTGNFAADADVREIFFTLSAPGSVTLRTLSYAGGVNSAGATIPAGGFDPTISVFDSGGRLVAYNRDGGCGNVAADAVTSFCWDSFLQVSLPAGNYTAVLTQSENLPNGPTLADSFVYNPALCVPALVCPTDANGNFTTAPGSAPPGFWDFSLRQRSSFYALDILGATASAVPAITSSAVLPSAIVSQPYQTTFTAAYGSGLALTWSVAAGSLPGGLALNAATGVLSGVPTSTGSFPFTIQVTDGVQAVMQSVLLTVSSPSIPVIPILPSPVVITGNLSLGDVAVGAPVAASYNAAGGAPPYTLPFVGRARPHGRFQRQRPRFGFASRQLQPPVDSNRFGKQQFLDHPEPRGSGHYRFFPGGNHHFRLQRQRQWRGRRASLLLLGVRRPAGPDLFGRHTDRPAGVPGNLHDRTCRSPIRTASPFPGTSRSQSPAPHRRY